MRSWWCSCSSVAKSYLTLRDPWTTAGQAPLSFTISWSLLKFTSIDLVMHPTISSALTPFFSCPQSFSASGSFPVSWLLTSGGQLGGVEKFQLAWDTLLRAWPMLQGNKLTHFQSNWALTARGHSLEALLPSAEVYTYHDSGYLFLRLLHAS